MNKWNTNGGDGSLLEASLMVDDETRELLEAAAEASADVAVSVVMVSDGAGPL